MIGLPQIIIKIAQGNQLIKSYLINDQELYERLKIYLYLFAVKFMINLIRLMIIYQQNTFRIDLMKFFKIEFSFH